MYKADKSRSRRSRRIFKHILLQSNYKRDLNEKYEKYKADKSVAEEFSYIYYFNPIIQPSVQCKMLCKFSTGYKNLAHENKL